MIILALNANSRETILAMKRIVAVPATVSSRLAIATDTSTASSASSILDKWLKKLPFTSSKQKSCFFYLTSPFGPHKRSKRSKTAPKRPKTPQNAPKRPKTPPKRPKTPQKRPFFDLKTPVFFSSVQVRNLLFYKGHPLYVTTGQIRIARF
jgi:hypothetical protein